MKKYKGNKKYDDICRLMKDKGMRVDTREFDKGDFVNFKGVWQTRYRLMCRRRLITLT
ncbi:MAG: hypothetical protein LBT06_20975 [Hungatella sp.]|jgi:hypothetical protein|nr:hypothetical protein [Hungatella sp.]